MEGYSLSPQQRRIWQLQETLPEYASTVSASVVVEEALDVPRLLQALTIVLSRHEILRTTFHKVNGLRFPVQVVQLNPTVPVSVVSAGDATTDSYAAEVETFYSGFRKQGWNFEDGPLFEAQVVRLSDSKSAVFFRTSALCSDAVGLYNVVKQVAQLYKGAAVEESDPPVQYADVSEYFNEALESEESAAERYKWERLRSESPSPPSLSAPFGDEPNQNLLAESTLRWTIDPVLSASVERMSLNNAIAVADIFLTGWQTVLLRFFRQAETSIGIVCDGRRLEGLATVPGPYERMLPFACRIKKDKTFRQQLNDVARDREQLLKLQDYSSSSSSEDGTSTTGVAFENFEPNLSLDHLAASRFTLDRSLYPDRLKLTYSRSGNTYSLQLTWRPPVISNQDAAVLQDQFNALLENACASPDEGMDRLSTLSMATRNLLVNEFNSTEKVYLGPLYAHQRFRSQAARTPEHSALIAGSNCLSYRNLDEQSTRLANILTARGIGPEAAVAVCMGRCPELLVSLLGVLKSGAYYIPIDPDYPIERLSFILQDSKAALVLSKAEWNGRMVADLPPTLNLDRGWDSDTSASQEPIRIYPENIAYVIYTSGSTGQPKGVAISHAALANYVSWCESNYDLDRGNGVLVHSPIGFDLTVTTLLAPLVAGQTLILVEGDDPTAELASLLSRNANFTLLKITPAHLQALSHLLEPNQLFNAVGTIILGGEALLTKDAAFWQAGSPQTRLINEYGPTEATVGCSVYEIPLQNPLRGPVPIGKAISNIKLHVLDAQMKLLPLQSAGDLYIGGAGLARGYVGRPDLTAERFVPDPFSQSPGARLYKTGDLAHYDSDGILHFLGRADNQIKLRGYRIELGEVEHTLREHTSVRDAAVMLTESGGQNQLVAYVVFKESREAPVAELRNFLTAKLPDYMVPTQIVSLDHLPLTFHGKVDRSSLPDLALQIVEPKSQYVAPRTPEETILADLWAKALRLERVGIRDNFFELGGDSIISIQIANRARQMGLKFTPRELFHHRTVAELAEVVKSNSAIRRVSTTSSEGRFEPTPIQRWFFEQKFAHPNHWNQAMLLEAHEPIEAALLEKAFVILVERHDALRQRFDDAGEITISQRSDSRLPFLSTLDLSAVPLEHRAEVLESFASELESSLNLSNGPVMKAGLLRGSTGKDQLLWVIHHLCVDVVSWSILIAELADVYRQLKKSEPVLLPDKTCSLQEWSVRLNEYAQSQTVAEEFNYWLSPERWRGAKLPVDFPDGANLESSVDIVWCSLDSDETSALVQTVPKTYRTMINDVLLSALVQALYHWTGERHFAIDLENHGREDLFEDVELSRTVGWFTCIFPISLSLASTHDCVLNLRTVKEQIRSVPAGGVGYGLLRYLRREGETRKALEKLPRSEINFNYLGRSSHKMDDEPLFSGCSGILGPTHNPATHRAYELEITGGIDGQGELRMAFLYSRARYRESSIRKLAEGFAEALRDVIKSCSKRSTVTESVDLSMTQLTERDLDHLMEQLSGSDENGD